jgi:TolB-like protein/DNA-binding winged helix-turn-helix (wHTH) protein/Tfp pilus assembly protein PilF
MNQEKRNFEFGPFRIDTVERLLFRGEATIPLTPKVADTLLALLANAGRIVEKDDLIKVIWPDSFVDEGGLARNVSALRKALGDGAGEAQYIETIPKRGYRFVGALQPETAETGAQASPVRRKKAHWLLAAGAALAVLALVLGWWAYRRARPEAQRFRSLVVLPLTNLSNDSTQDYVADGMTEGLIDALTKIEALRVISFTTAMTYKGAGKTLPRIARELNVDAVVEGSVAHSAAHVEIKVRLFDARADKQLWGETYPGDLGNVLRLQNEAAESIADKIRVKLTPVEKERLARSRPVNPAAWLDYSHGRQFWDRRTPQGIQGAIDYFGRAIRDDPKYAQAYSGLADAYALLGSTGADAMPPREAMLEAKKDAQMAVTLDRDLAEGHTSLGYVLLSYDWDPSGARREFDRAIELNPRYATAHHWFAHYWLALGQPEKALAESRQAQLLDPSSPVIDVGVGWCLYHGRRFDEAIKEYRAALEISPEFGLAHALLGMALEHSGAYAQAIEEFNKASQLGASPSFVLAGLGCAHALAGHAREARGVLDQLDAKAGRKEYVPAVSRAAIWAALGNRDRGIEWTRKAVEERSDYVVYLGTEPWADPLRADPRFQQILQEVKAQPGKAQ